MTGKAVPYTLLTWLTVAFAVVAGLSFALTGAYLYRSLSTELQRRDDIEISGKLSQFLQLAHASGSAQNIRSTPAVFHEVLLSHPGAYLGIYDAQNNRLVEHTAVPGVTLKSIASGDHPSRVPYTCDPVGICTGERSEWSVTTRARLSICDFP